MPNKYKDLMFDEEIDALVAFLATLKDASVNTPKPIKMKITSFQVVDATQN